ncbi:CopD family protein [Kineococcus gynurae]|uniref:CopD family protein n=1 Tax=Kineococcus gynurae TaxID=452979 RepID=A0ABV5LWW9_9ACTN
MAVRPAPAPTSPSSDFRPDRRRVAALVTVGLVAVVGFGLLGGGLTPADAAAAGGRVAYWAQPVVGWTARVAAVMCSGTILLAVCWIPNPGTVLSAPALAVLRGARGWAVLWTVAAVAAVGLRLHDLTGLGPVALLRTGPTGWWDQVGARSDLETAAVVLLLLAGLLLLLRTGPSGAIAPVAHGRAALLLAPLVLAVLPQTLAGHSAHAANPRLAALALTVHVLAATTWVGGLAAVLRHRRELGTGAVWTAGRFSGWAAAAVLALVLSGLVSLLVTVDDVPAALGSAWGALLLVKVGLLVPAVGAGLVHRRWTLPALRAGSPRAFLRWATAEMVVLVLALAAAVALATTPGP